MVEHHDACRYKGGTVLTKKKYNHDLFWFHRAEDSFRGHVRVDVDQLISLPETHLTILSILPAPKP